MLCTDSFLASATQGKSVLKRLRDAGLRVTVLDAAEPELPLACVESALADIRASAPDVVVGLGGGSSLDLAKLIALGLSADRPYQDYYGESNAMGHAATGARAADDGRHGLGGDAGRGAQRSGAHLEGRDLQPAADPVAAICDPLLTLGAPAQLTAHTGIDALAHAIESYCAVQRDGWDEIDGKVFVGRNVFSDEYGLRAMALLNGSLERAVRRRSRRARRCAPRQPLRGPRLRRGRARDWPTRCSTRSAPGPARRTAWASGSCCRT